MLLLNGPDRLREVCAMLREPVVDQTEYHTRQEYAALLLNGAFSFMQQDRMINTSAIMWDWLAGKIWAAAGESSLWYRESPGHLREIHPLWSEAMRPNLGALESALWCGHPCTVVAVENLICTLARDPYVGAATREWMKAKSSLFHLGAMRRRLAGKYCFDHAQKGRTFVRGLCPCDDRRREALIDAVTAHVAA